MRSLEGFVLPALITLLLHAVVIVLLTANWQPERERVLKPMPRHVQAKIVTLDKATVKKPAVAKPRVEPPKPKVEAPKPKPKVEAPKPKPQPKPQPKPVVKPKPDPKVLEQARRREEQKKAEERQRQRERELAIAMAAEEEAMQAETDTELAMAYTDAIQAAIEDNWSRPPSARHDMEVILRIQLIPTGDVVSVSVLKSSGNEAFDRSALNAVQKAARFPEVANAPPRVFESSLRSFQLVFHPEDLRL